VISSQSLFEGKKEEGALSLPSLIEDPRTECTGLTSSFCYIFWKTLYLRIEGGGKSRTSER